MIRVTIVRWMVWSAIMITALLMAVILISAATDVGPIRAGLVGGAIVSGAFFFASKLCHDWRVLR